MGERIYIDSSLFLENDVLHDSGKLIPVGELRHKKTLRYLLENADTDCSCYDLYKSCFRSKKRESDAEGRVREVIQQLWKAHETLDRCIQQTQSGYVFRMPLQLKPDFVRETMLMSMVFKPCSFHERREDVLADMMSRAFQDRNYFLIYGAPGIGKTELAWDFAGKCCKERGRYRYVLSVKYEKSLAETITTLKTENTKKTKDQLADYLKKLEELQKQGQVLLIVDNMDIDTEAFLPDQELCMQICNMGIHVLFTSRFRQGVFFDGASIELHPMQIDSLRSVFIKSSSGRCNVSETRLDRLLEEGLHRNTYLTVLAGKLMDYRADFSILENALLKEDGDAQEIPYPVFAEKDGLVKKDTLMNHFKSLYHLSTVSAFQQKMMWALCLVPLAGMDREAFLKRAFRDAGDREKARMELDRLIDSFWVIRSNFDTVCMHPMVRSMILKEIKSSSAIRSYVDSTARELYNPEYDPNLMPQLVLANTAYGVIERQKLNLPETAFLVAQIASTWDTLTDYEKSCYYGMEALRLLDAVDHRHLSVSDLHWRAVCYNVVGYAMNHTRTEEATAASKQALERAESLVEEALQQPATEEENKKLLLLRSKIHGNHAARCINAGQYEEALSRHRKVLEDREALCMRYGNDYRENVAVSHKNIGTVQHYVAKKNLMDSYDSHCKAVNLYRNRSKKIKGDQQCVAIHRAIGSMLRVIEMSGDVEFEKAYHVPVEEKLLQLLFDEIKVMQYLVEKAPLVNELRNGFENACKILYLAHQKGICSGELSSGAETIRAMQFRIPEEKRRKLSSATSLLDRLL